MKIKLNNPFYAVGEIDSKTAREAHIKAAAIFITRDVLAHIQTRHPRELAAMGLTPEAFVEKILNNYTEIRQGSRGSYLLTVPGKKLHDVTAIGLEIRLIGLYNFWLIKTAFPMSTRQIARKKLIYTKKKPTK